MHIENITEKTWRVRRNRVWRYNGGVDLSMVMHWKSCFVNWDLKLSLFHNERKRQRSMYTPRQFTHTKNGADGVAEVGRARDAVRGDCYPCSGVIRARVLTTWHFMRGHPWSPPGHSLRTSFPSRWTGIADQQLPSTYS